MVVVGRRFDEIVLIAHPDATCKSDHARPGLEWRGILTGESIYDFQQTSRSDTVTGRMGKRNNPKRPFSARLKGPMGLIGSRQQPFLAGGAFGGSVKIDAAPLERGVSCCAARLKCSERAGRPQSRERGLLRGDNGFFPWTRGTYVLKAP